MQYKSKMHFPQPSPTSVPLLCTLTRVGIAMLPWQICYLQHHLPTTQGRKTPYFHTAMAPQLWAPREANSWLALPNSRSPKQGCAGEPSLSLMEQKTLWEKPNTKGQAKETFLPCSHMTPGKLLCILIPLLIEARSHSLLPDKILGRRGWRSLKVFSQQTLQNFKALSALKGEQAASVQCETPNWKRSPQ